MPQPFSILMGYPINALLFLSVQSKQLNYVHSTITSEGTVYNTYTCKYFKATSLQ